MAFQPKLARRRRTAAATKPRPWRVAILSVAGLAGLAGLFAIVPNLPARADPGTARRELALSLTQFQRGATTAARNHAREAVRADPSWGLAHAVLARYLLELDEGAAAQAELDRAKEVGFDAKRAHQLYAHAYLLQGDFERAIATAHQAPEPYRAYAARIVGRALAVEGATAAAWTQLSVVAAQAPRNSRAWSDLGRVHQGAGDLAAAAIAATKAIALDPANGDALVLRGELIRAQYGLLGALPWFEAALKRDPANHEALIEYAATLGEAGRYAEMLSATRRALIAKPGSPEAYYLQAVLAARSGNDELARSLMDKTGGRLSGMPGALLLGGALDYGAGAWRQAIAQWGDLVGQQPKNIAARRLLAAALLRTGDGKGALDVLRPIAIRDDADSYTLNLVGRAFEQGGQRDWAARFLDRASAVARADAEPFGTDASLAMLGQAAAASKTPATSIELVRALLAAGASDVALDRAQAIVRQNPGTPAAYLLVGDIHAAAKRWPQAVVAYKAAGSRRFDEPTALRLLDAQDKAGDRAAAANTLALFLSQNPANIAAQRVAAHWQIADGDWDTAIETLEALRKRVGNRDAALLAELAYAFLGKNDAAGAEAYAAAAYRIAPSNPAAADAWGWALYQLGDYDRAGQLLEKAATIAPYTANLRWHLAQTYAALGFKDRAARQARVALLDRSFKDRAAAQAMANGV
ncbi:MAG: tetratricopeptide repeat protein [Pseudomonadota bacterium]